MIQIDNIYVYGQDGEIVEQNHIDIFGLTLKDIRYDKKTNEYYYDFVGFIFNGEKILVVFPKNYYKKSELFNFNLKEIKLKSEIKLLYDAIQKYSSNPQSKAKASNYIGAKEEFISDYPFSAFYNIYDYFRKYGLYKDQDYIIKEGFQGNISWKASIQKSKIIVSNNNLIFAPLFIKKRNELTGFISDCMAFVIDYTITYFNDFISLPMTHHRKNMFDYFNNIDYIIKKLHEFKRNIRKDAERLLLDNLIIFFIEYRTNCTGGNIHVKINYFEQIWQNAVNEYLNSYYDHFDKTKHELVFNIKRKNSVLKFYRKSFYIDISNNNYSIEVDHYAFDGTTLYVLDSKYYIRLDQFNYKQYSYNEILRYSDVKIKNIVSVLLLPGEKNSDRHFELDATLIGNRKFGNLICVQYVKVEDVLKNYIR